MVVNGGAREEARVYRRRCCSVARMGTQSHIEGKPEPMVPTAFKSVAAAGNGKEEKGGL